MVQLTPNKAEELLAFLTEDTKIYPETLYYAKRVSGGGHQPVFKKLLPDGEPVELSPRPSQKLWNHNPDGFNFGYGGSGPAQLSLTLLLDATTDPEIAGTFHQRFKWDKVAGWGDEWSITRSEILLWLEVEKAHLALAQLGKN